MRSQLDGCKNKPETKITEILSLSSSAFNGESIKPVSANMTRTVSFGNSLAHFVTLN